MGARLSEIIVGAGLLAMAITTMDLKYRSDAIASKPAPTGNATVLAQHFTQRDKPHPVAFGQGAILKDFHQPFSPCRAAQHA
ncbi:hypothetical protein PS685_02964 [Pseudomonas fluorescens]|uniref:Uncharacterized protein n=1 Tax=Pseudomonas fluorescens TaxID=294 RepID=A0A5E6Z003_PSEFL|nr:hypothetical protein PS685_02964 [Pseudomonas fluorescens]